MSWGERVEKLLKPFGKGGTAGAVSGDPDKIFDEVRKAAPSNVIAEGLASAFRSNETPPFGQLLSTLFMNSNGEQKSGMLNLLISAIRPAVLSEVLSGSGLEGILAGEGAKFTPELAQKLKHEVVAQLATEAEKANPRIIDTISSFYAQHAALIKTLGPSILAIVLTKIRERQKAA